MRCSKCGSENPLGKKFCGDCGGPLGNPCPKCGADNPVEKRFCGECGAALVNTGPANAPKVSTAKPTPPQVRVTAEHPAGDALDGERKTVTALFADIKGSTELEQDLDPEEARAIIDPALKLMIDAVRRYDGYVVQSTGDGIFALFGAPVAHEDHPQRALYAALRMQEDMGRYSAKFVADGGMPIEARVGCNTGEVVVRSITTGVGQVEYTPIGHTTNLASRMQAVAPTGSIAVSQNSQKLVEGYFALKPLGPTRVRGIAHPVNVYEVTGLGPLRTRLQRSVGRGLTKFVGRQREIDAMKHAAEQAKAGNGQIVAAMAEPGVGKSRLLHEFKATSQTGWTLLETFSISHGKASAYLPVIDLLRNYFDISAGDDERKRREKVTGRVLALDRSLEDTLPYLFSLLGIVEGDDPLAQMEQIKKRRTLEAIKRIVLRESLNQPVMVVFEDLHWIDRETQDLLNLFADSIGTAKVLLLVNYRPEYSHQWNSKTYYTQLRLDPLGRENAEEMLSALLGDGKDLIPLKRLILERTEGTPFFMEEMVQALFEDGVLYGNGTVKLGRSMNTVKVPTTVQAVLASRIDRLSAEDKELLQTLAVLGREFPLALVQRVMLRPDDDLEPMLSRLQAAEFIYEQLATGDLEYVFKHALTQQVAYDALLIERRKLLHERAAAAIELLYSDHLDGHLSELAHHYSHSANTRKAVHYLGLAGRRAMDHTAYPEALALLTQGLELVAVLPDDPERALEEFDLQNALGWSLYTTNAGAAEREIAFVRAKELGERLGDKARLVEALVSLSNVRFNRADMQSARELAEQAVRLAEPLDDSGSLAQAHFQLGQVLFWLGELTAALQHSERALELLGLGKPRTFAEADNRRFVTFYLVFVLVFLGFPDTALKRSRRALDAARESNDPVAIAHSLMTEAFANWILRDAERVLWRAEEELAMGNEFGMGYHVSLGTAFRDWALVAQGRAEEGLAETEIPTATEGWEFVIDMLSTLRLESYRASGRFKEAIELAAEMVARSQKGGGRFAVFTLLCRQAQAEVLVSERVPAEAKVCLRQVIDLTRRMEAKFLELRATTSLARLLAKQGKRDKARAMLAEIYNWFTEGFDTADLKDAKSLLEELET